MATQKRVAAADSWPLLAQLYAFSTLSDRRIARGLALDVTLNPHRYREVSGGVGEILAGFQTRLGTDPEWPSAAQREELYASLLGVPFANVCATVRSAAVMLVEHQGPANEALRSVFVDAAATASAYFKTLEGQALATAAGRTQAVFAGAVRLLRTQAVVGAFGLNAAAPDGSPFDGAMHAETAALVEVLATTLNVARSRPLISRHRFLLLQRAALHGARTLTGLLDRNASAQKGNIDDGVQAAYLWEKALQNLLFGLDVPRAWKDPAYREGLTRPEQSLLPPHPSGEVSVEGTELDRRLAVGLRPRGGFSTYTVTGICCCTGDLPCPASGIIALGERLAERAIGGPGR